MVVFSKGTEGCLDNLLKDIDLDTQLGLVFVTNVCRQQDERHTHLCTQTTTTTLPLVKRIKLKRFNCYCVHSV